MDFKTIFAELAEAAKTDYKGEEWITLAAREEGWNGYGWLTAADFLARNGITWQRIVDRHK